MYGCPEKTCIFFKIGMLPGSLGRHVAIKHPGIEFDLKDCHKISGDRDREYQELSGIPNILRWNYLYKCPVKSCLYHEKGISSRSLGAHVRQKHPGVVYAGTERVCGDDGEPIKADIYVARQYAKRKRYRTQQRNIEKRDRIVSEPNGAEPEEPPTAPDLPPPDTPELTAEKYIKNGFDEENIKKLFNPVTFSGLCIKCYVDFPSAAILAFHSPCHFEVRPGSLLKCPECDMIRSHPDAMRVHLIKQHLKETIKFECKECKIQTFGHDDSLKHLKESHCDARFLCTFDQCIKWFPGRESCKQHVLTDHLADN